MCHIVGIEPQFENIISNGPYIPMAAGQRNPKVQWTPDERKATKLDRRLKSLIMFVLPNDQINFVINCLIAKSTWDILILYHEGPYDVKEKSELAYLLGKLKYEENLIDCIYGTNKEKTLVSATTLSAAFFSTSIVKDFQDSPDDEEGARSSQEYMNDLEEEYQPRALLAKSNVSSKGYAMVCSAKQLIKLNATNVAEKISEAEDSTLPTHDTGKVPPDKSQRNMTVSCCCLGTDISQKDKKPSKKRQNRTRDGKVCEDEAQSKSRADYDNLGNFIYKRKKGEKRKKEEDCGGAYSFYSTPLSLLEKLAGVKPVFGPKTIKLILKSKSTFKAEALKGVIINEPSSAPAKGKSASHWLSYDHDTLGHNKIISLRRGIKPRNPQHVTKNCETCGSNVHTITDHNEIEWFRKIEALQAKKAGIFKTSKIESSSALIKDSH
ncbi:hypothetical protein Tco_1104957 [Tanacetum coccineum]